MRLYFLSTLALLFIMVAADKCICNDRDQLQAACGTVGGTIQDGFCITKKSDKFLNKCAGICKVDPKKPSCFGSLKDRLKLFSTGRCS
ncbi:hypothetical protein LY78DRAFT_654758 [Colletotrichum sublineola]|nr:hypothetical protein LY78DRAFT_654758 [Colletotrichum sublineola]